MTPGRPRNHAEHLYRAVDGLVASMNGLLDTLGAAGPKLPPELEHAPDTPGRGKGNRKPWSASSRAAQAKKMRAYWKRRKAGKGAATSTRTAKAKAKRPAKSKPGTKRAAMPKQAKSRPGGAWASMTPEQRAQRVAKMQAGRARRPGAVAPKSVVVSSPAREASLLND